jgi:hypothetical protein
MKAAANQFWDRPCLRSIPTNFGSCNGSLLQSADRWGISAMAPALPWQWLYLNLSLSKRTAVPSSDSSCRGKPRIVLCNRPNNGHRIPNCRTSSGYSHPFCSVP